MTRIGHCASGKVKEPAKHSLPFGPAHVTTERTQILRLRPSVPINRIGVVTVSSESITP
jgi:hypothetical protein